MWIKRDFLENWSQNQCLEALLLRGPRQIGKTSILLKMQPTIRSKIFLDDPNERHKAMQDPEFVLSQLELPTLIDEIQRAPELLYSIKKNIDEWRRERIDTNRATMPAAFRMTGSNQTEIDSALKETLAGRISIFHVHGLSVHEILGFDSATSLKQILFNGGFPELWIRPELNAVSFLNDYISTFIEKDIAQTAGVEKLSAFSTTLRLLAARIGELLNFESIGNDAGVAGKSVKDWVSLLEQNGILYILKPYHSNLNKRLIKMPKAYFIDTGLCVRLQSHQEKESILSVPQAGHLFENLVVAEAIKTRDHYGKNWNMHFWRTKEKEEIDLIVESDTVMTLLQIKLGSTRSGELQIPAALASANKKIRRAFVTAVGKRGLEADGIEIVPLQDFCQYLLEA
ncbi:MAG: ATP-binding protein [Oligoflexia bacterium]|nr:ATP-binding protein [Oligoflexia bacterium]